MSAKHTILKTSAIMAAALLAGAVSSAALAAGTVTGTIGAKITLEGACEVNGNPGVDSGVDFGAIDFGTHSTLFTQADDSVLNAGGAIKVLCSPGLEPTFTITSGTYDGQGTGGGIHAMKHTTEAEYVTYNLYTDSAGGTALALNTPFTVPGTADGETPQELQLFGRAFGAPGLVSGVYNDTLNVQVDF